MENQVYNGSDEKEAYAKEIRERAESTEDVIEVEMISRNLETSCQ